MAKIEVVARVPDDQKHEDDGQVVRLHDGRVFTSGDDAKVKFSRPTFLTPLPEHDMEAVLVHSDRLLTCSADGKVKVFDQRDLKLLHDFRAHDYAVTDLLVVGNTLFTCSADATVRLWDARTLELRRTVGGREEAVRKLATDGESVFSGDDKGEVHVHDLNGDLKARYNVVEEVWGLHVQGDLLYTVRDRGLTVTQIKKGDSTKFSVNASFEGRAPMCVVGDDLVVVDTTGMTIHVHDNAPISYDLRGKLQGHEMIITALGGCGRRLVSAGWEGTARLWDLPQLRPLAACPLPGTASGIAVAEDGSAFAVGSGGFVCKMRVSQDSEGGV